jgi:hypothetical protein
MAEPRVELDPRFSNPNAVPTAWAETRRVLEAAERTGAGMATDVQESTT